MSVSGSNYKKAIEVINTELYVLENWLCFKKSTKNKRMKLGSRNTCKLFKAENLQIQINTETINKS